MELMQANSTRAAKTVMKQRMMNVSMAVAYPT
jgi:hypothetical protein